MFKVEYQVTFAPVCTSLVHDVEYRSQQYAEDDAIKLAVIRRFLAAVAWVYIWDRPCGLP